MKQLIIALICFALSTQVKAQQGNSQLINTKIQEVFADKAQELVLNDPLRLEIYTDLLENRIKIIESPKSTDEKCIKLSDVALLNKYNPNLTRDVVFDPNNFNALKYNFNILPKTPAVYRVDNTNYLIVIQAQTLNK